MDILFNLLVGVVASVLTLIGDRCLSRWKLERRLRPLAGKYRIVPGSSSSGRETAGETITISHTSERRFSIRSSSCRVGDWVGSFVISDVNPDCGRGIYTHIDYKGWGTHDYQIEARTGRILVYGSNQDRAGAIAPFSYILEKVPNDEYAQRGGGQQTPVGDVQKAALAK